MNKFFFLQPHTLMCIKNIKCFRGLIITDGFLLSLPLVSNSDKVPFSDLPERTWFKVVIFGQMGVDRCRQLWRWRCFLVLIGIVGFATTISASDSDDKQEQLVSRIAFGSCSNQSAPQVSIFLYLFLLYFFILFCFVLSLFFLLTHVAVPFIGTDMLMILFLCFNHDVPILVPTCCFLSKCYVSF